MGSYDEVRGRICRDLASLSIFFDLREATFSTFSFWGRVWIAEAVSTIIAGGPINISRTIDVRLNKMIEDLKGWHHNDMWKGVHTQNVT